MDYRSRTGNYVACICEGAAEQAIMNILMDANALIFNKEDLIDRDIIRERKARKFEVKYLNMDYESKIDVYRIVDSKSDNFKLRKVYESKVNIKNILTKPEIEILTIISFGKYDDFHKKKTKGFDKPSSYCKGVLGIKSVKSKGFIEKHFSDYEKLIEAIIKYNEKSDKKDLSIYYLLKEEFKNK